MANGYRNTLVQQIKDAGQELICNKCGRPDYPKCKETVCEAWKYHESKKQ